MLGDATALFDPVAAREHYLAAGPLFARISSGEQKGVSCEEYKHGGLLNAMATYFMPGAPPHLIDDGEARVAWKLEHWSGCPDRSER